MALVFIGIQQYSQPAPATHFLYEHGIFHPPPRPSSGHFNFNRSDLSSQQHTRYHTAGHFRHKEDNEEKASRALVDH